MPIPKFYLIKSSLTEEEAAQVSHALTICAPVGTFVFCEEDAKQAQSLSEAPVVGLDSPLAITGQFSAPLTVVNDDGSVQEIPIGSAK
jgi:hypothetical protein